MQLADGLNNTEKPASVSWGSSKSYVCEHLSEFKDIKYIKVQCTETLIKLNVCQKWGGGGEGGGKGQKHQYSL